MGKQGDLPRRKPRLPGRKHHRSPDPEDQQQNDDDQDQVQHADEQRDQDVTMTDPASSPPSHHDDVDFPVDFPVEEPVEGDNIMQGIEWIGGSSVPPSPASDQEWETESESDDDDDALVDIDELRIGDLEDAIAQATQSGIPLDDVLGAEDYEDIVVAVESEPFDEINAPEEEEGPPGPTRPRDEDDTSVLVPVRQDKSVQMTEFEMALATFVDLTGLSRKNWEALRETLFLLRDEAGNVPKAVRLLPPQKSTLLNRMRKRMPMMHMREADIPLNVVKLPTLPANVKDSERRKLEISRIRQELKKAINTAKKTESRVKRHKGTAEELQALMLAADRAKARLEKLKASSTTELARLGAESQSANDRDAGPLPIVTTPLTFFDPPTLFKNIAASDLGRRAHSGPGHFVDNPHEFFESDAWLSSVRTTSGQYAHVILDDSDGTKGPVIFPCDWIYYRCTKTPDRCPLACNNVPDEYVHAKAHIGRVYAVGFDHRKKACTPDPKQLCLRVQEAYRRGAAALNAPLTPEQEPRELILTDKLTYIPETKVYAHVVTKVYTDYSFGEDHRDPGFTVKPRLGARQKQQQAPFPKYDQPVLRSPWNKDTHFYMVRRMIMGTNRDVVPICHTHPTRAELELDHFSREVFENEWDQAREGCLPVISFPHIDFIDGFGVFRNSYRTLMGYYFTPAGLTMEERMKPGSIFPLLLGPHGSNFGDITKAMTTMADLDKGMIVDMPRKIPGHESKKARLCAFPICYTGDMPQQAENSGFKGPRGTKFCRCCFTFSKSAGKRGTSPIDPDAQINFDIVNHGRYHLQIMEMQQYMAALNASSIKRYGTQWGISDPFPALARLSPALDIVMSRPPDAAHSEFNGIACMVHLLFCFTLLTPAARVQYIVQLQAWPFPPGWGRLQSPYKHLKSYKMSEHGRWLIIIPTLLLHWLKRDHLNQRFCTRAEAETGKDPVELLIETMAKLAKSATLLMGTKVSKHDRRRLSEIVHEARHLFNQLHVFAYGVSGSTAASVSGSAAGTPLGDTPTPAPPSQAGSEEDDSAPKGKSEQDRTFRPNVHIAVHYEAFTKEYGLPVNCNTLTGEDMHRWFKRKVYETNFSNVEKVLLMKMNFQETIRLVLLNTFEDPDADPELTALMAELHRKCPTLFNRTLSHSDRNDMRDKEEELEYDIDMPQADPNHLSPAAINGIPVKELELITHVANEGQPLPRFATIDYMTATWTKLLRHAYRYDYGAPPDYPPVFNEHRKIQFSRKLAFTDSASNYRFKFSCNDYIKFVYRRDNESQSEYRIGRIDHIFVMDYYKARHIFALVIPIKRTKARQPLLDLEIVEEIPDEPIIIGISAIRPVCLYMVRVEGVGVVAVDWDVHTL